ncbi:vitamin B12 ABC transporter permease BtuC [Vibrio sp. WJH972]
MNLSQIAEQEQKSWASTIKRMTIAMLLLSIGYTLVGDLVINPFDGLDQLEQQLLFQLRIPRLVAALVIGASLAISGATLQILLRNVLAEPGVIGVSGGASVAMVVLITFFPFAANTFGYTAGAIAGAISFTVVLVAMARVHRLSTTRLLLVGVVLGIISSSIVTLAFYFSDELSLRQLMYWLMGSLSGVSFTQFYVLLIPFPVIYWLIKQANRLDKIMLGEIHAQQLGIDVYKLRWKLIVAVSLLVGCSVAIAGVIGFLGLVIPHIVRLAIGTENRYLLPTSAVAGAMFLVFSDLIARTVLTNAELPLGVVTTLFGAPVFIWMLVKSHDYR